MSRIVVLGGGTAGHDGGEQAAPPVGPARWEIAVVDRDDIHLYQPGYLFLPFGRYRPADVVRSRHAYIPDGVHLVLGEVDRVVPERHSVLARRRPAASPTTTWSSRPGCTPRPDQTPGHARRRLAARASSTSTPTTGAVALAEALPAFDGGRLVVHIVDMPIKCPVAPLEFAFLADAYLRRTGPAGPGRADLRDTAAGRVHQAGRRRAAGLACWTTRDRAGDRLRGRARRRTRTLVSYDEREIPFDLLVTVPLNMGADYVARSGLGDELNYVPVDRHTLRSTAYPNDLRHRRRDRHARRRRPARWRTSRSTSSSRTSSARRRPADDRVASTATRTASSSPATARPCSSTSTTTPSRCRGSTRCRGVGPFQPARRDPGQPPRQARRSAGCTGTCCCPAARSRCRPTCPWPARPRARRTDTTGR